MDLGTSRLRKVGVNSLHCAVHPQHGVVWTDGKGIYLVPISVDGHHVQNSASVKLGEFANVTSVHWSSVTCGGTCHMCVVHKQNVTVWRVSGALPKLNFKQVRKINVQTIPQGCLWNPCNDILCLLSRCQCSFYFRHDLNKGSHAFPALESGCITCGCWNLDGTKLIICVGTVLLIYRWSNISAALDDFAATSWRIPGFEDRLTSIAPVLTDSIVVTAEVSLESLCKPQDMLQMPDAHSSSDDIRLLKSTSAMDNLMNLWPHSQTVSDPRCTLTVVQLSDKSQDPVKLSTVPLKGVLTPDILLYEKGSQSIVVGSNSQSQLHIYALLDKHLAYCGNIQLEKNQRPKGLCSMPNNAGVHESALLILVGQRDVEESGFLSSSLESEFKLSLKYVILKPGSNHHSRHNHHVDSTGNRLSLNKGSSSVIKTEPGTAYYVKIFNDPSLKKCLENGRYEQMPAATSMIDVSEVSLSPRKASLTGLEKLETKPLAYENIHQRNVITNLSNDTTPEDQYLQVERVSFHSQAPAFDNKKLAACYQLKHPDKSLNKQAVSSPDSTPELLPTHLNSQMSQSGMSAEKELLTDIGKQLTPNFAPHRTDITNCCHQKDISSGNVNDYTQQEESLCFSLSHCQVDSLSNRQAMSQAGKVTVLMLPRPEVKLPTTTMLSQSSTDSSESLPSYLTSTLCQLSPNSMLTDSIQSTEVVTNTSLDRSLQMSLISPQKDHVQTVEHITNFPFTSLQMPSICSQTNIVETKKTVTNSMPDTTLQMSLICSQNDNIHTPETFCNLSEERPQLSPLYSQTQNDSLDSWTLPEPIVTVTMSSASSQTQVKAETKTIISQTEEGCPVHCTHVHPEFTHETTDHLLQIGPESVDKFSISAFPMTPEASSACLHTSSSPSEQVRSVWSIPGRTCTDILDVNYTLTAQNQGHTKEVMLPDLRLSSLHHSMDSSLEALEEEAKSQKESIDALHHRLQLISSSMDKTTCEFSTKYQDISKAETIEIDCEKPEGTQTKKFLLDQGRLQLEPIKLTFGLATVELWLDGIPCVTGANIDGYIPLKFSPSTRLHITGRPADK